MEVKITLGGTEYLLKYTLRALFIFERLAGKSLKFETTLDTYIFFYSVILANNPGAIGLTFENFIDLLDKEPEVIIDFTKFLSQSDTLNGMLEEDNEGEESGGTEGND